MKCFRRAAKSSSTKILSNIGNVQFSWALIISVKIAFDCVVHHISFIPQMKEKYDNVVELTRVSKEVMEVIVDFFYSGKIRLNLGNVFDVLEAADYLMVESRLQLEIHVFTI